MGFFPAISLGWLGSGESFWKDNLVSNLKLRFSHGEVGNESKIGYNNVTWETAVKTNLGLDLGLWKDRFSLQMDFFYEKRKGILMQRQSVPTGAGFLAASVLWGNL